MSLSIVHADGRKYALERDVIALFPRIAENAAASLGAGDWADDLRDYATFAGLMPSDVVAAGGSAARLIAAGAQIPYERDKSLADVWRASGLYELTKPAVVALFRSLGMWFVSAHHHYAREALKRRQTAVGADAAAEDSARAAWALARGKKLEAAGLDIVERTPGTGLKYAASRDVVYFFLDAAREASVELANGWPKTIAPYAGHYGLTTADLVPAVSALTGLAELATTEVGPDPDHAWSMTGLDGAKPPVRLAVFATLGFELVYGYHEHASATVAAAGGA